MRISREISWHQHYRQYSFLWCWFISVLENHCRWYWEMCRMNKIKFGGSTCFAQIISLTKQNLNLNKFKIKVYNSAEVLCQGPHNVVVVFADVVVLVVAFIDVVVVVVTFADVVVVVVFAFGVRRSGNVFARKRGVSQVLVE